MTKRGIVDPWRTVEAVRPKMRTTEPEHERIDLDDIDRDADLAIPGKYVIRSKHVSFDVTSVRVQRPVDALDVLADCIADLFLDKTTGPALTAAGIAVRCRDRTWNAPSDETPASTFKGGSTVIWFIEKPIDQGMHTLARVLRTPAAAPILRRHGIIVMMTAS